MTVGPDELLTTGEVAALLRSSRQHVVDLCERGLLPYVRVGTHRRVWRADVEAVLRPELTRDQLKALWLHRAVAGRLVMDPATVLSEARVNLDRLRRIHPDGKAAVWLDRWRTVLEGGAEAVLDVLTSRTPPSPRSGEKPGSVKREQLEAGSARWPLTWPRATRIFSTGSPNDDLGLADQVRIACGQSPRCLEGDQIRKRAGLRRALTPRGGARRESYRPESRESQLRAGLTSPDSIASPTSWRMRRS